MVPSTRVVLERLLWAAAASSLVIFTGCSGQPQNTGPKVVTITEHEKYFPIGATAVHALNKSTADGPFACESCHRSAAMTEVSCIGCHKHPTDPVNGRDVNDTLHLDAPNYASHVPPGADVITKSEGCRSCHKDGRRLLAHFPHGNISAGAGSFCAACHNDGTAFDALAIKKVELPTFKHVDMGGNDCGACHTKLDTWTGASGAIPANAADPKKDITVDALTPTWSATSIVRVTPDSQVLHMTMNHSARSLDAGVMAGCGNCHDQADQGSYYPGVMHFSLISLGVPQPNTCTDCHGAAIPRGFVGDLDPKRNPSTGAMKHDAVAWANGAPTSTKLVPADCVVCHQPPPDPDSPWEWAYGKADAGAKFHTSLQSAGQPQPNGCLDCHANSRPTTPVTTGQFTFDHSNAKGECKDCHTSTTTWAGAKFHTTSSPTPTTCLPCHDTERPTSTSTWMGAWRTSPFDYVTNVAGVTHGNDEDCVTCHNNAGTGVWGVNPNWQKGQFGHAPTGSAGTTCIACHSTQRPDLLTPIVDAGFDHAASGTGDCIGCHGASMTRGSFVNLLPIPGGDWRGGTTYPGSVLISSPNQFVRLQSTTLTRANGKVTGMTSGTVTLPNSFTHTSSAIPAAISAGPVNNPDMNSCWHCHTHTAGTTNVTGYSNGKFHSALQNFSSTPTGTISPLAQPTACGDCHRTMRPPNIVSKTDAGTWLLPMDHGATFTGGSVAGVANMDCGSCHRTPGLGATQWSDGKFHSNLPAGAAPSECVSCHYPLMTTPLADVTMPDAGLPSTFAMKHRSTLVTAQACETCHTTALQKSTTSPTTAPLWRAGDYHRTASPQPASCTECHGDSDPTATKPGSLIYTLTQGGTASNGAQYMSHTVNSVASLECALCHAADAKTSGSAWAKNAPFHAKVPGVTTCNKCHGLGNGLGTVAGTNNNLPAGVTDTVTITTSSAASANTHDQISHADLNATSHECSFCHTQVGVGTGKEWAKAAFHKNFTSANPLVVNGSTGRCSNCHMNVKPGSTYTQFDHAPFTSTSAQDCASCHSWPGTSPTTPNWKGATGQPHASTGATATSALDCNTCHGQNGSAQKHLAVAAANHYGGVSNGNKCTSCHINFAGWKDTIANLKYGHTNSSANSGGCITCHTFNGSLYTTLTTTPPLSYPTTSGGHQFSQSKSVSADGRSGTHADSKFTRCGACHRYSNTSSTSNIWTWGHRPSNPGISSNTGSGGCNWCH